MLEPDARLTAAEECNSVTVQVHRALGDLAPVKRKDGKAKKAPDRSLERQHPGPLSLFG